MQISNKISLFSTAMLCYIGCSYAGDATNLYSAVSKNIGVVTVFDSSGKKVSLGSAVIIDSGNAITNCHVLKNGSKYELKVGTVSSSLKLKYSDYERDLCQLSMGSLKVKALRVRRVDSLSVGEKVYVIGSPRGLELTLSDGIVSSLRTTVDGKLIQITAPISPGSSGGGVFDADGRLVGISTFYLKDSQNLNFALPADWISQLASRSSELANGKDASNKEVTAETLIEENKWDALITFGSDWKQENPRSDKAYYYIGYGLNEKRKFTEALEVLKRGESINQKSSALLTSIGVAYAGLEQHDKAIEAYLAAIKIDSSNDASWNNLGNAYANVGQNEKAEKAYKEGLKINGRSDNTWYSLGVVQARMNQDQLAIKSYESALTYDPRNKKAWHNMGNAYRRIGNINKSTIAFQEAIKIDKDYVSAMYNLAINYSSSGRRSEAMDLLAQIKLLDQKVFEALEKKLSN